MTLPFDVWVVIASFVGPEALCRLYSVNQALFKLSMDERYRVLALDTSDRRRIEDMLLRLESPCRAERVREVVISLRQVGFLPFNRQPFDEWKERVVGDEGLDYAYVGPPPTAKKKKGILGLGRDKDKAKDKAATEGGEGKPTKPPRVYMAGELSVLESLQWTLDTIRSLPNIQTVSVDDNWGDFSAADWTTATPLALGAWRSTQSTLRTLRLTLTVEALDDIFPAPDVYFAQLEAFEVDLTLRYRNTDMMEALENSVVRFVNLHAGTLRKFAFRTPEHLPLTRMFEQIGTVPLLSCFALQQGYVSVLQTDTSGLCGFLKRHAETLLDVTLSFIALGTDLVIDPLMEKWSQQECLKVEYAGLRRFALCLKDFPEDFGVRVKEALGGVWSPTLRHLKVKVDPELKTKQVEEVFGEVPEEARALRSLTLGVLESESISENITVLSKSLPEITDLEFNIPRLTVFNARRVEGSDGNIEHKDVINLLIRQYGGKLERLSIPNLKMQGSNKLLVDLSQMFRLPLASS